MLPLVAERGCGYVAMHWRGHSSDMQTRAIYADVVSDVTAELTARRDAALAAGVPTDRLLLDPGLGFAKHAEHNWALLAALDRLTELGPLLVGASRKGFLGALLAVPAARRDPRSQRDDATAAITVLAAQAGAWAVRVHAARASADAVRVVAATAAAASEAGRLGAAMSDVDDAQAVNAALYEAFETADVDRMQRLWDDVAPDAVVCVHPGWPMLRGPRAGPALVVGGDRQHRLHPVLPHRRARARAGRHRRRHVHGERPHRGHRLRARRWHRRRDQRARPPTRRLAGAGAPRLAGPGRAGRRVARRALSR